MINYSVSLVGNPRDPSQPKKAYARVQIDKYYDVQRFAKHIATHNNKYSHGDIYAVLETAARYMKELVQQGCKVSLGDLGDFTPAITCKAADSVKDFTDENIVNVRVKWEPPQEFENLLEGAEFQRVVSRRKHKQLLKYENERFANQQLAENKTADSTAAPPENE